MTKTTHKSAKFITHWSPLKRTKSRGAASNTTEASKNTLWHDPFCHSAYEHNVITMRISRSPKRIISKTICEVNGLTKTSN